MNHAIYYASVRLARRLHYVFVVAVMVFLVAPILSVVPISFSSGSFLTYPLPGFSLQWYDQIFAPRPWMEALKNSLVVGSLATLLATTLGTLAALGFARAKLPAQSFLFGLVISPMIVPLVVTAVAMYFFFAKLGLVATFTGLVIAHAVLGIPFVVVTVTATLQGFDRNLVKAAASLGANPLYTFRRITLPLILPGVVSGALFAFATSFDEVVVALFIAGPAQRTLPRQMFDGIRDNIDPSILAMSTLLIFVAVLLMIVAGWLVKRSNQLRGTM